MFHFEKEKTVETIKKLVFARDEQDELLGGAQCSYSVYYYRDE